MKLPYGGAARPEQITRKLATYALDVDHPQGMHKAILFSARLGITIENKEVLVDALLDRAANSDAIFMRTTQYGDHYLLDFRLTTDTGTSVIRSAWIVRTGEPHPDLVSVYPI